MQQQDQNQLRIPDQAYLQRELSKISEENSFITNNEHPNTGHLFQTELKNEEDRFENLEEEIDAQQRTKTVEPHL